MGVGLGHPISRKGCRRQEALRFLGAPLVQAGTHMASWIQWLENVLPILQPSHSSELNPVERLWQEPRKRFKGKNDELIEALENALFKQTKGLTQRAVVSLTGYSYI